MAILRTIRCDVCGRTETEAAPGTGWPGWGHLAGLVDDSVLIEQPSNQVALCPEDLMAVAGFLNERRKR